jgi:hypothetical protein
VRAIAVGGEAGGAGEALLAAGDDVQAAGGRNAAEYLSNDVGKKVARGEAAAGVEADRDGTRLVARVVSVVSRLAIRGASVEPLIQMRRKMRLR